jgi:uncharacterized Zn finger protein (UPF0148 family)
MHPHAPQPCPHCDTMLVEVDGEPYCPHCDAPRGSACQDDGCEYCSPE